MALFSIDTLTVHLWRPGPPRLIEQMRTAHNRPGGDGTGEQYVGKWGKPFTSKITTFYSSFAAAVAKQPAFLALKEKDRVNVVWEGVAWHTTFNTRFSVAEVENFEIKQVLHARSTVAGYYFPISGRLDCDITLIPHQI